MRLEDLTKDALVEGIEPGQPVRVVTAVPIGDAAITLYYKTMDGAVHERMVFRHEELNLSFAEAGRPFAFTADGDTFKLATEALRINLAYLFDPMMAVHTSNVDPLPHQITAVYESLLPRQPLRFVLADDPGSGKTIMAGLYIRELLMRADAERILIVAPGSLVEQWQDELFEKFGLEFTIFSRELEVQSRTGNPFEDHPRLIARLDMLSRNEDLREKLEHVSWDLVVVDEAHKMSASYYGQKLKKTGRFTLGELLGSHTRHLLLMTATPHNGKEADFQLFLSLLDSDRFFGRFRDGVHKVDVSDLMRRMVKERLVKFDGTPLFPERRAYTAKYELSTPEAALYEAVTEYVREEMNKADQIQNEQRRRNVGFALTSIQRRLASSPEAIFQTLRRRRMRLQARVEEERLRLRGISANGAATLVEVSEPPAVDDEDDYSAEAWETTEEEVTNQSTAARTIGELESECATLERLEEQARGVVLSGTDKKWEELSTLLQSKEMRDRDGQQRKLIIFSEYKDTITYLLDRIRGLLGDPGAVVTITGSTPRDARRNVQELFRNDPRVRVLVATDAAGEGVNLQNANLMVNYDLPWNPNRIEQRFGRIHRIGQTEICHLWNMVALGTREGDVFLRLFEKIENERKALGGQVFDILGEVFEEVSLRDLLIRAIRGEGGSGRSTTVLPELDDAFDPERLRDIIERNALAAEMLDEQRLFAVREEMEKAEAQKLQPFFIRSFFVQGFGRFGGELRAREPGRWEITNVPYKVRERDRLLQNRDRRYPAPVLTKYERVCFEREYVRLLDRVGAPMASLIHPGHPLMQAVVDLVIEEGRGTLRQGAVFVDPNDPGTEPYVLLILEHEVLEGTDTRRAISRRLQFVALSGPNEAKSAGYAPHLDLEPLGDADRALLGDVLGADWITHDLEGLALGYASGNLVPAHFAEVQSRRTEEVDRVLAAVNERLVKEINFWSGRYLSLQDDLKAGKDVRLPLENVRRTVEEMSGRLESRKRELTAMRHVVSATPVVVGAALVIPAGLLAVRRGEKKPVETEVDAAARKAVELVAMRAVMDAERALGHEVTDVSALNLGWDVTSRPPRRADGSVPDPRHIEVKGRAKGQTTVTVSKNEVLAGLTLGDKFYLAVVLVEDEAYEGPFYVRRPFSQAIDWAEVSRTMGLVALLERAVAPGDV